MPSTNVTFEPSLTNFRDHVRNYGAKVNAKIDKAVEKITLKTFNKLRRMTRHRTGNLRGGWNQRIRKGSKDITTALIYNNVEYGKYTTIRGTATRGGQPLTEKFAEVMDAAFKELQDEINHILNEEARKFNNG